MDEWYLKSLLEERGEILLDDFDMLSLLRRAGINAISLEKLDTNQFRIKVERLEDVK